MFETLTQHPEPAWERGSTPTNSLVGKPTNQPEFEKLRKDTPKALRKIRSKTRYPVTKNLPLDAEKRITEAFNFASSIGCPLSIMLTVYAAHLQRIGAESVFEIGHLHDGFQCFHELLREWTVYRNVPWASVWVREYTGGKNAHHGEHWHLCIHMPPKHRTAFSAYVARLTGEDVGKRHAKNKREISRSVNNAWHIAKADIGAARYLGKATPRTRKRYGETIPNELRSSQRGGGEGAIQGKRLGISKSIGRTAQSRSQTL